MLDRYNLQSNYVHTTYIRSNQSTFFSHALAFGIAKGVQFG